jgi:hypothetical protein
MRAQLRGFLQLLFLFAVVLVLIRLFPVVVRIGGAAALSLRALWWVVLIFALGGWLIWVVRKRNSG